MDPNGKKPRAREKHVTEGVADVHKEGEGLGTGPVGSADGYASRKEDHSAPREGAAPGEGRPQGGKAPGGHHGGPGGRGPGGDRVSVAGFDLSDPKIKKLAIIAAVLIPILIIGFIIFMKTSGGEGGIGGTISSLIGGNTLPSGFAGEQEGGYTQAAAVEADKTVASGSRAKRTQIQGGGKDTVTIMVYMCGTDLESRSGMASSDLSEMAAADISDKVNIIVYTGGCNGWKTSGISAKVNQIYKVTKGGLQQLVADDGSKAMVDPATLTGFIKYCKDNFPANRNELIFWDHGGGSVTGYGYDEKNKSKGSMDLAGINKALKNSGMTFDFVGFDACLMATAETALMLNDYADYMIASEETEPGIGWYYTNWLNKLSKDTSMSTVDLGKIIVDDFVTTCDAKCRGQQTTLSVIDLAEFANTVPSKLSGFSKSVTGLIDKKEYKTVSDARYATREFARSSGIDQVDFVDLADKLGTEEGKALVSALKGAVKYNRTSSNMTNAYGVSIYFPYQRASMVDSAVSTYNDIGMDSEYAKCIRQFASLETSGQIAVQGASNPIASLLGGVSGGSSGSSDLIGSLLSGFLGGGGGKSIPGLDSGNTDFMKELDQQSAAEYLAANYFDVSNLKWKTQGESYYLDIPEEQWKLVHKLDLNTFVDDGAGYIDLGLDNVYTFDGNKLIADTSRTWLTVTGTVDGEKKSQAVAYYHTDTVDDGSRYTTNGYIPALLNGERVKILVAFDTEHPDGYITGAERDYREGETETIAKSTAGLEVGDTIRFLCDYYDYNGNYTDSYQLGGLYTVTEDMALSNMSLGDKKLKLTYRFTDIYNQEYWTEAIDK